MSGVSTHLNHLLDSRLADDFELGHFVVGSEGRDETTASKTVRLLLSPFALATRILRDGIDIVHVNVAFNHKGFPRDALYLAVARLLRRRVVFQVHGGALPGRLYKSGFLRDQVVRRVLDAADVVVLLAQYEFEAYRRFAPHARLKVIANGTVVHERELTQKRAKDAPLRLTYLGRLVPSKGVAECLAAAQLLKEADRRFTLTIAGSGPQEASLKEQAGTLVKEGLVEFVGAKFGGEKDEIWRETDIFVFPTYHAEGLPYALLESMAAGAVPITTRIGAQKDIIEEGVHGLFVVSHDPHALFKAIAELDDDRERMFEMSNQCVQLVRRDYSIERLTQDFGDLYRSLETGGVRENLNGTAG